eukprot:765134-Hanusia_phi.AAC.3
MGGLGRLTEVVRCCVTVVVLEATSRKGSSCWRKEKTRSSSSSLPLNSSDVLAASVKVDRPIRIEVSDASAEAKRIIEEAGGEVIIAYYNRLGAQIARGFEIVESDESAATRFAVNPPMLEGVCCVQRLRALLKPEEFERIPRRAAPPPKLMWKYPLHYKQVQVDSLLCVPQDLDETLGTNAETVIDQTCDMKLSQLRQFFSIP